MALYNDSSTRFHTIASHTSASLFWLLYQIKIFDLLQKPVPDNHVNTVRPVTHFGVKSVSWKTIQWKTNKD